MKEILITGERVFTDYIGRMLKEVFEVSSYEGVMVGSWEWEFIEGDLFSRNKYEFKSCGT